MSTEDIQLRPEEKRLVGNWIVTPSGTSGDATCARIQALTRSQLRRIAADSTGWDALYQDPTDGRLWELTYPQSESHGGGPPALLQISRDDARQKYGYNVDI
jgi:immunity protein 27 of polymorphic toxin system